MEPENATATGDANFTRRHSIYIACAGWSVLTPQHVHFSEKGSVLQRYSSRLRAVEINSSFYKPHQAKTYRRWALSVPQDFRFSVKVPKSITHEHALIGCVSLVDSFLGGCLELDSKLGGLLVQLPPSLMFDARHANAFFGILRRRLPAEVAIACEPRNVSWFAPKSELVFSRYGVNRIAADPPIPRDSAEIEPSATGAWRYWRLHGAPRVYYSTYSRAFLQRLVPLLLRAVEAADVWVVFDNTANGHAIANALTLNRLLDPALP